MSMSNNNLIGISGKISSGKDTVAQMIQLLSENYNDSDIIKIVKNELLEWREETKSRKWKIKRFADKLKDCVCLFLGCTREQLEDRKFKETLLGEEWWYYKVRDSKGFKYSLKPYLDNDENELHKDWLEVHLIKLTPRLLMQLLGTEAGREIIHPDLWVNALFADYKPVENVHSRAFEDTTYPGVSLKVLGTYPNWLIPDTRFPNETKAIKDRGGILIRVNRMEQWEIDLRNKLQEELPDKLYDLSSEKMSLATGKGGKIDFEVALRKEVNSYKQHFSETALDDYKDWDYLISNNEGIEELFEKVKDIVKKERLL